MAVRTRPIRFEDRHKTSSRPPPFGDATSVDEGTTPRAAITQKGHDARRRVARGLWTAGDLYYSFFLSELEEAPVPSIADALYLGFYPIAYAALALLLLRRIDRFHGNLWLDGVIGGLVVCAVGAAVVLEPVMSTTGGAKLAVLTNLAYPLFDLLLLALLVGVIALNGWRSTGRGC